MSIASSSQPDPAYKLYRKYKDKDDWDGDIFLKRQPPPPPYPYNSDDDEQTPPPPSPPPAEVIRDEEPAFPPPYIVLVQGPPKVGKSTLIKSLVRWFSPSAPRIDDIRGPVYLMLGETRIQFVECSDDINGMIDAAKYADAVLLLVDASYGFEVETFEFLNLLQAHSFPPVMGVFTHADKFETCELDETIARLQDQFQTEVSQEAATFCVGLRHGYHDGVTLLARHIDELQTCYSSWQVAQPYVLVDDIKDVTPPEKVQEDTNCNRNISLYGYLRGSNIKSRAKVHIAGVGDFLVANVRKTTEPSLLMFDKGKVNDSVELTHVENECFIIGTYLRLEVHDVPSHVVENYDPLRPILVGGISLEEDDVGYMQARLKRHNWHMKLLKSSDLMTVSAGWRRYQTKLIYSSKIDNERYEILDGSPEHEHCLAMFWGPIAPAHTRVIVVHGTKEVFRIAAKAVVLGPEYHLKIMKECELKGKPYKILGERSAQVKFELKDIDVTDFKGSPIRVQRIGFRRVGIWGVVHEAAKGRRIARCIFKKPIFNSDTFVMPVFCQVGPPNFFKPCDSNKAPLKKRKLRFERRRRVEVIDGEPCSYPHSSYFILHLNIKYKNTVMVMSEKKRLELLSKQDAENNKKVSEIVAGW